MMRHLKKRNWGMKSDGGGDDDDDDDDNDDDDGGGDKQNNVAKAFSTEYRTVHTVKPIVGIFL